MSHNGWIGVDLDGTLAFYDQWRGSDHIGKPIPTMIERVKAWLSEGQEVRIVTARVSSTPESVKKQRDAAISMITIQDWCLAQFGQMLPVVCVKDFAMIELWDDRAVQVERNTGIRIDVRVPGEKGNAKP